MSVERAAITVLGSASTTSPTSTPKQLPKTLPDTLAQEDGDNNGETGEEEALEWAQVIELQAFSERNAWIEEKTRVRTYLHLISCPTKMDVVSRTDATNRSICCSRFSALGIGRD
jgi:hypothetical protein